MYFSSCVLEFIDITMRIHTHSGRGLPKAWKRAYGTPRTASS